MLNQYPYPESEGSRSIVIGILVTLVTCGIYGFIGNTSRWQHLMLG